MRTSNIHETYDTFKLQTLDNFPYQPEIEEIFMRETNAESVIYARYLREVAGKCAKYLSHGTS